jgi:hypothetical protein
MREWLELVDRLLRPARPDLAWCVAARAEHLAARERAAASRALAVAGCVRRIEAARAAVFAANDGVISSRMTELEREWRILSRPDPDGGLMDLWARIAPARWIDKKCWRDAEPAGRVDAAIALAADADGVDAAESAVQALRTALLPWGVDVGARVRFRASARESADLVALLAEPLRAARASLAATDAEAVVLSRARECERLIHEAVLARLPERPFLARDVGHAAMVDFLWRARTPSAARSSNPVTPLCALWRTGYAAIAIEASGVTLEIPA